jgi:hypothetical protein
VALELPSLSCPRPKEVDCDATPNAPNAIVAVAAIAYFGVKYFLKEVDSSFVFLFSKVVDSMLFSVEVIIAFSDVWKVREMGVVLVVKC